MLSKIIGVSLPSIPMTPLPALAIHPSPFIAGPATSAINPSFTVRSRVPSSSSENLISACATLSARLTMSSVKGSMPASIAVSAALLILSNTPPRPLFCAAARSAAAPCSVTATFISLNASTPPINTTFAARTASLPKITASAALRCSCVSPPRAFSN